MSQWHIFGMEQGYMIFASHCEKASARVSVFWRSTSRCLLVVCQWQQLCVEVKKSRIRGILLKSFLTKMGCSSVFCLTPVLQEDPPALSWVKCRQRHRANSPCSFASFSRPRSEQINLHHCPTESCSCEHAGRKPLSLPTVCLLLQRHCSANPRKSRVSVFGTMAEMGHFSPPKRQNRSINPEMAVKWNRWTVIEPHHSVFSTHWSVVIAVAWKIKVNIEIHAISASWNSYSITFLRKLWVLEGLFGLFQQR